MHLTFTPTSATLPFLDDAIFREPDAQRRLYRIMSARADSGHLGHARADYNWIEALQPDWWMYIDLWGRDDFETLPRLMGAEPDGFWDNVVWRPDGTFRIRSTGDLWHDRNLEAWARVAAKDHVWIGADDVVTLLKDVYRTLKAWAVTAVEIAEQTYTFARGRVYQAGQPRRKRGQRRRFDAAAMVGA